MTTTMTDWIRPWWPGRDGDHINAECPTLARETSAPKEGAGWLDPATATLNDLCQECFDWNATCQCGASLAGESGAGPRSKKAAEKWAAEHFCIPSIDLTPTPREPAVSTPSADQTALFALEPRR